MSDTSLLFTIFAVDKASSVVGKTGSAFSKMALGIGIAAAGVAVKTTMMAANFQSNMLKLQTSAGESAGNMKLVSNGVLAMATQTGDSATALSSALYTVESGGQHGANGLLVLKAAAQGAKAEGADLNTVADATTSILQDYHLKASQAANVTSQLVATTGAGKTTFEQLAGSLHSVLPIASATHVALSDILGAEASMTVHGMSADQASQNLADTIKHMAAPTIAQTKYLGQLGISGQQLNDDLASKGLTGTLQMISTTILQKMGPAGKVLLGTFNQSKQAGADVTAMVNGMSPAMQKLAKQFESGSITSKDWTADLKYMSPIQANQLQQFATLEKRASGFSDALKSGTPAAASYAAALRGAMGDSTGLNTALMLTGENTTYTNNAVRAISKSTADAKGNVKGWSEIQGTFNVRLSQAKEQIEVTGIRIGTTLLPAMTGLVTALGRSVGWLTRHTTIAKAAGIAVGTLAAAVLLYKTYMLGTLAVEKIEDGYLLAKRGVMATITAAQWAWNAAQEASNTSLFTWIGVQAIDFAGWVRKTAVVIGDTAAMLAQEAAIVAVSVASKVWAAAQWLVNIAMDANPVGLIIIGVAALVAGILYLWFHCKPFRTFMIAMWHDIWDVLKKVGEWFAGPFKDFWVRTYDLLKNGFITLALWVHNKVAEIKATLSRIWDTLRSGTIAVALWIHNKIDSIIGFFSAMPHRISSAASGMFDGLKNAFRSALNWIIGKWNNLQFSIPSVNTHIPGIGSVGGFTLGTPNIPYMAAGGTVMTPGVVNVGERGPERVFLPAGAQVVGHRSGAGPTGGGAQPITICMHVKGSVKDVMREISAEVRGNYGGVVQLALSGQH